MSVVRLRTAISSSPIHEICLVVSIFWKSYNYLCLKPKPTPITATPRATCCIYCSSRMLSDIVLVTLNIIVFSAHVQPTNARISLSKSFIIGGLALHRIYNLTKNFAPILARNYRCQVAPLSVTTSLDRESPLRNSFVVTKCPNSMGSKSHSTSEYRLKRPVHRRIPMYDQ